MAVKGVFFDLYGTLLEYQDMQAAWATWETTLYQPLYPYGLTVSPGVFATHCDRFFGKPALAAPAEGCTVFEGRIQTVCHTLHLDVPTAAIKAIATTLGTAWQQYIPIDPECLQVLQTLHSRYTLGLISNFDHPPHVHQVLADHGLRQWFAVIVISGEVGVQKPHPQIFCVALEQTGLTPADVVYVGDTADDVQGACAAGMHPILIHRAHQRRQAVDFQVHAPDKRIRLPQHRLSPGRSASQQAIVLEGTRMIKAIFWDNDGVLVDTERLYFRATQQVLATVGMRLTTVQYIDLFLVQGTWQQNQDSLPVPSSNCTTNAIPSTARYSVKSRSLLLASEKYSTLYMGYT